MRYEVQVLRMGRCDVRGPEVYWSSHWEDWLTLYFYMVVIRGGSHLAIVNTGPPPDLTDLNEQWTAYAGPRCRMISDEEDRPEIALASIGIRPEEVTHVIITPLQCYATGNIPLFRNAQICLSRKGWIEDFHAPRFPMESPRQTRLPDDVLRYLVLDHPEKVRLLHDEEEEIIPGLRTRWVGVHHRSSLSVDVETQDGVVVISDAAFHYGNVEIPHPLGIFESLEECHLAYQRFRQADIFIPLYDPAVLERFPGGRITKR